MSKQKCSKCGKLATWAYVPGKISDVYCDNCVPRGCSCNSYPIDDNYNNLKPENWKEELDEDGRKLPCCEYWYDPEGWDNEYKEIADGIYNNCTGMVDCLCNKCNAE